jgi:hypothetical protein
MASSFLGTLPAEDHLSVMRHPADRRNVGLVEWLITLLRRCRTFQATTMSNGRSSSTSTTAKSTAPSVVGTPRALT